jgi:uncharacterized SAM-binding protein YcdF (DUF218 family)
MMFASTIKMTNLATVSDMPRRGQRFVSRPAAAALLLIILAAIVWLERAPLLRDAADLWVVSDPVTAADAVAVLGGDLEVRPFVAAELYNKAIVPKVLVSQVPVGRSSTIGGIPGHSELNRMVLLKLGVPDAAIEMFGQANSSTKDEAAALRDWADEHRVSRIIIPTEIFAARRVRWIFDREFSGSAVRFEIAAFEPPSYTRAEWCMIAFQNEFMKYLYYRLKY